MAHSKFCASSRKHRFRDHDEAVQALHHAKNARYAASRDGATTRRREVRAYRCRECNGWHLTSQDKRTEQREPAPLTMQGVDPATTAAGNIRGPIPAQFVRGLQVAPGPRVRTTQDVQVANRWAVNQ